MQQEQIDKIADVIWWIKGAMETDPECRISLNSSHIEALRDARIQLMWERDAAAAPSEHGGAS